MNNNSGSAVAMILMILAVVSLLGVGLLVQSNLDVQMTSAVRSYDRMFSLADGGASIAYKDICEFTHTLPLPMDDNDPATDDDDPLKNRGHNSRYWIKNSLGADIKDIYAELPDARQPTGVPADAKSGFYRTEEISSSSILLDVKPAALDLPGYDIEPGKFSQHFMVAEGTSQRHDTFSRMEPVDVDDPITNKVYLACVKIVFGN